MLTEGQLHESPIALELLKEVSLAGVNVVSDRAHGGIAIRDYITRRDEHYTIPPRNNVAPWSVDWWNYKERHSIECFFNRLKHYRCVATRYDKTALYTLTPVLSTTPGNPLRASFQQTINPEYRALHPITAMPSFDRLHNSHYAFQAETDEPLNRVLGNE